MIPRLFSPFKREREQAELDAMKAQSRFLWRLYWRGFCGAVVVLSGVSLYEAGWYAAEASLVAQRCASLLH